MLSTQESVQPAWVLTGPTGSGKSSLALRLAEEGNAEIVSMDSMSLYRGMDIGTAKPTPADRHRVPHHLIDVLHPWEAANVAWWLGEAKRLRREIESRGHRALFVGGTPLYLKAMLHGLFDGPPRDDDVRKRLEEQARSEGPAVLHDRLALVDPVSAARLHPNDVRRVTRALEVWELTSRPISSWQQEWGRPNVNSTLQCWWIDRPRAELYARIDTRVEQMIEAGWVNEVRALLQLPRPLSREAGQALGYAEIRQYIEGRVSLVDTVARIKTRSRQFAKRQLTWFRALPACRALSAPDKLIHDVLLRRNNDETRK